MESRPSGPKQVFPWKSLGRKKSGFFALKHVTRTVLIFLRSSPDPYSVVLSIEPPFVPMPGIGDNCSEIRTLRGPS